MFLDALLLLSDAQAISADAYSTNTIDLGNSTVKRRIGTGEPMALAIQVDVAADHTDGDETYAFQLLQSANADLSSGDIIELRTISYADLTAGKILYLNLPPGQPTKRYIGLYIDVGGTTPTITLTAWLTPLSMIEQRTDYAIGSAML